jgi:uncharacterized protein (TIGR03435 family)
MKERELEEVLTRGFTRHGESSPEQVASDLARIRERLEPDVTRTPAFRLTGRAIDSPYAVASAFGRRETRWLPAAVAAGLVIACAIGTAVVWRPSEAALYRVVEGDVYQGETIRSNGGGAVLALADGSRIELRSNTELAVDRADDGVRIRLSRGGIIVNAATQRTGHLYVQTQDLTVSVVGTVFVVNADAGGSRVAVIEGEVRVQQGTTETKLRPGEAAATSPRLEAFSVASELAWSRRARDLTALLQRAQQPSTAAQATKDRVAFEVISIRSAAAAPPPVPGARGGGAGLNSRPAPSGCVFDSFGYSLQLDPRRMAVNRATLLHLAAYTIPPLRQEVGRRQDVNCDSLTKVGLLSGGPDWIRTDVWDVVAAIPEGAFTRPPALTDPVLQQMLKTMLSERFGLVMRRETREVPVYLLKVGKEGPKFNGAKPITTNTDPNKGPVFILMGPDGKPVPAATAPPPTEGTFNILGGFAFAARSVSMADWANHLFGIGGRPVLDRTGLAGRYDFYYDDPAGRPRTLAAPDRGALDRAVLKAMGFELEESRAPYDAWVIERAEKPTEN